MKNMLFMLMLMVWSAQIIAQSSSSGIVLNKVSYGNRADQFNDQLLRNNLQQQLGLFDGETVFGSLFCDAFFSRLSEEQISGMARKKVMQFALDLNFYDVVLDQPYQTVTINLSGTGADEKAAAAAAIQNLRSKRKEINIVKDKVLQMQADALQSCERVQLRLDALSREKAHAKILALTNSVKVDHPCYSGVAGYRTAAYAAQQAAGCRQAITRVRAGIAAGDFENASRYLMQIDPTLECSQEIDQLIAEMGAKFSEQQMQTLEWYIRYKSEEADIQKAQLGIISNLVLKELLHAH